MPHIHSWEPFKTETREYWLGDVVKKTTYKCRGCTDRLTKVSKPTARFELFVVGLVTVVAIVFVAIMRHRHG